MHVHFTISSISCVFPTIVTVQQHILPPPAPYVMHLGHRFPSLAHLSLDHALDRELDSEAFKRKRDWDNSTASYRRKRDGLEPWDDPEPKLSGSTIGVDNSDNESKLLADMARRTSPAGWRSLLCLPRGLFSLKVNAICLCSESYALLQANVTELHCGHVLSPVEIARAKDPEVVDKKKAASLKLRLGKMKQIHGDRAEAVMAEEDAAFAVGFAARWKVLKEGVARTKALASIKYAKHLLESGGSSALLAAADVESN